MTRRRTPDEEAAAAAFYEEHVDDPDVWAAPVEPPVDLETPRGVSSIVTVRFPPEDAAILRRLAETTERSYSDIIRRAVRAYRDRLAGSEIATIHVTLSTTTLTWRGLTEVGKLPHLPIAV